MAQQFIIPAEVEKMAGKYAPGGAADDSGQSKFVIPDEVEKMAGRYAKPPPPPPKPGLWDAIKSAVKLDMPSADLPGITPEQARGALETPSGLPSLYEARPARQQVPSAPEPERPLGNTSDEMQAGVDALLQPSPQPEPKPKNWSVLDQPATGEALRLHEQQRGSISPSGMQKIQAEAAANRPYAEAKPFSTEQNIAQDVREFSRNPAYRGVVSGFSQLGQTGIGAARLAADLVGADAAAQFFSQTGNTAKTIGEGATQDLKGDNKLVADIFSSITNSVPSVVLGMAGGPALRTLFAQSFMQEYGEGRNSGLDVGNAMGRGVVFGMAEALGERFGFPQQIKLLKSVTKGMPSNQVAHVFADMLRKEVPGEQLTTLMQFLADKIGPQALHPNATLDDYLNAVVDTFKVTVGQTLLMGGGPAALNVTRNAAQRADAVSSLTGPQFSRLNALQNFITPSAAQGMAPTELRATALDRFDELSAAYGVNPKAAARAREAASSMPAGDVPGFLSRLVEAYGVRGLTAKPIDEQSLSDLQATVDPAGAATGAPEASAPPTTQGAEDGQEGQQGQQGRQAQEEGLLNQPPTGPTTPVGQAQDLQQAKQGQQAQEPRQDEPPQAEDAVRFYHGGAPEGVTGPLWFTSDRRDANGWASRSKDMQVWYVDVPRGTKGVDWGDHANGVIMPTRQELPAELASQRKPLVAQPAQQPKIEDYTGLDETIDDAAHEAATSPLNDKPEPTDGQKEAGNYAKGHVRISGMDVSIENPKGSVRSGKSDGSSWMVLMPAHYGYIRRSEGVDGDHVDIFVGDQGDNGKFWVINQHKVDSSTIDEHKIVTGVESSDAAVDLYKRSYTGKFADRIFGSISRQMTADEIKAALPSMKKAAPVTAPIANVTERDLAKTPAPAAGAGAAGGTQLGGGGGTVGPGPAVPAGVDTHPSAPAAGGEPAATAAPAGQPNAALTGQQGLSDDDLSNLFDEAAAELRGQPAPVEQPAQTRVIGKYGRTPKTASDIELRPNPDGTLTPYSGKYPMADFESGNPIVLRGDITDAQAVGEIRKAGAIGKQDKVYGVKADEAPAQTGPENAAPAGEKAAETGPPTGITAEPAGAPFDMEAAMKRLDGLKALMKCLLT